MTNAPSNQSFNLLQPSMLITDLINLFMVRSTDDHSFDPLSIKNILKVVKLTHSCPDHPNIIHLTFCNQGYVKGYLIKLFMDRGPDYYSFNPLPQLIC